MTPSTPITPITHSITRGLSVMIIASLAGLASCEREPTPSSTTPPASREPDRTGEKPHAVPVPNSPATPDKAVPPAPSSPEKTPPGQPPVPVIASETMTRYLGDVAEATTILRGVRDASTAGSAAARLSEVADRINTGAAALEALPGDQKKRLREQNRAPLARAVADFRAEVDRISGDTSLGASLKRTTDGIRLFE
ncbi:MAG: hypothetical protein IT436_07890 [Phycisphaerales bacterium]|nr:hypothetical protein [Phycisphaerales bacterium]